MSNVQGDNKRQQANEPAAGANSSTVATAAKTVTMPPPPTNTTTTTTKATSIANTITTTTMNSAQGWVPGSAASVTGKGDAICRLKQLQQQQQIAPLASLDCSITEPISYSHTSVTCTPTLSGYFDCDELSDMVDDSLFEITNAGCLSRSIFGADSSDCLKGNNNNSNNSSQQQHESQSKSECTSQLSQRRQQRVCKTTLVAGEAEEEGEQEERVRTKGLKDRVAGVAVSASSRCREVDSDRGESGSATPTNEPPLVLAPLLASLWPTTTAMMATTTTLRGSATQTTTTPPKTTIVTTTTAAAAAAVAASTITTATAVLVPVPQTSLASASLSERVQTEPPPVSQVAMLANYKPYDYSSTTYTPAQTRLQRLGQQQTAQFQQPTTSGEVFAVGSCSTQQQRSKTTRFSSAPSSGRGAGGSGEMRGDQLTAPLASRRQQRKTRSNPDVRGSDATIQGQGQSGSRQECESCRELLQALPTAGHQSSQTPKPTTTPSRKKKEKRRRFTFSLFNLFTGTGSSSDNQEDKRDSTKTTAAATVTTSCCAHTKQLVPLGQVAADSSGSAAGDRRQPNRRKANSSSKGKSLSGNGNGNVAIGASGAIKTRDSIRLTNQRKQRNEQQQRAAAAANVRQSNSYTDFQQQQLGRLATPAELLLDFSTGPMKSEHHSPAVGASGANYSSSSSSNNNNNIRSGSVGNLNNGNSSNGSINNKSQRQTKSVKFTMLDRVMIMSTSSSSSGLRTGSSSNLPRAGLQPSASIIKRPVPKSSSYSQTESSKNLDEMLARYAVNEDLILEINEKLKLTETIASPISVLDQFGKLETEKAKVASSHIEDNNNNDDDDDDEEDDDDGGGGVDGDGDGDDRADDLNDRDDCDDRDDDKQLVAKLDSPGLGGQVKVAYGAEQAFARNANCATSTANYNETVASSTTNEFGGVSRAIIKFDSAASGNAAQVPAVAAVVSDTISGESDLCKANIISYPNSSNSTQQQQLTMATTTTTNKTKTTGSITSNEAEEAGFSKDWLNKQRALV